MILGTLDFCSSACPALAPSKHAQQAIAAGRTAWQEAKSKTANTQVLTQRGSVRTPGARRLQGFFGCWQGAGSEAARFGQRAGRSQECPALSHAVAHL